VLLFVIHRNPIPYPDDLSRKEKIFFDEDGQIEGRFEAKYGDRDYPYLRVK